MCEVEGGRWKKMRSKLWRVVGVAPKAAPHERAFQSHRTRTVNVILLSTTLWLKRDWTKTS